MATSLASALIKVPVQRDLAMTGEITLRGRVLPIGGLKEKLLAAHRSGITTVVIPKENRKDLREVPRRVLKATRIVLVEHMDDVLREALCLPEQRQLFGNPARAVGVPRRGAGYIASDSVPLGPASIAPAGRPWTSRIRQRPNPLSPPPA